MKITESLPFDHCQDCKEFVLSVKEQIYYSADKASHRELVVQCKNAWLCRQLKEQLAKEISRDEKSMQ